MDSSLLKTLVLGEHKNPQLKFELCPFVLHTDSYIIVSTLNKGDFN